jgi:NTP pyrophosphatase (non-canonical NTP hydrolase)
LTYNEIKNKVIEWANQRNIISEKNINTQLLKFFEESGELSKAILENNNTNIIDSIGDVLVTLEILVADLNKANIINKSLIDCYETAYNEIKNRKGKTENGVFVKEEKNHNVICKCVNVTDIEMSEKKNNYGRNVVKFIANCSKCKKVYRAGFILEIGECIETSMNKINKAIQEYIRTIYK